MIIYSESFHVEHTVEKEWTLWVKEVLIPQMNKTGVFTKAVFAKVTSHSDETGNTYSIQYYTTDRIKLDVFYKEYSKIIAEMIYSTFGAKVLSFKTELDLLDIVDF